jgi:hypothetical protein
MYVSLFSFKKNWKFAVVSILMRYYLIQSDDDIVKLSPLRLLCSLLLVWNRKCYTIQQNFVKRERKKVKANLQTEQMVKNSRKCIFVPAN